MQPPSAWRLQAVNTVTVRAWATVPTTFMRLANFTNLTVTSSGEATRRMVDLSLVLDVSSSTVKQHLHRARARLADLLSEATEEVAGDVD